MKALILLPIVNVLCRNRKSKSDVNYGNTFYLFINIVLIKKTVGSTCIPSNSYSKGF